MFYGIYSIKHYYFIIINGNNFINEPVPASPYYLYIYIYIYIYIHIYINLFDKRLIWFQKKNFQGN